MAAVQARRCRRRSRCTRAPRRRRSWRRARARRRARSSRPLPRRSARAPRSIARSPRRSWARRPCSLPESDCRSRRDARRDGNCTRLIACLASSVVGRRRRSPVAIEASTHEALQRAAKDHLWLHFSTMASYADRDVPVIVRGEGCHLYDTLDRRYLDMLAGLFTVQIGYSHGEELGEVAAEQMRRLPFYTNWTYAHPPAIELAEKLAEITPDEHQPLLLRLGRQRGGRGRLEARAPVPRAPRTADAPQGDRAQARLPRHDDGRALDHRHHRDPHAVRAADPRRRGTSRTRTATAASTARTSPSARSAAPTRSPRRSSSRGPTPSRW